MSAFQPHSIRAVFRMLWQHRVLFAAGFGRNLRGGTSVAKSCLLNTSSRSVTLHRSAGARLKDARVREVSGGFGNVEVRGAE